MKNIEYMEKIPYNSVSDNYKRDSLIESTGKEVKKKRKGKEIALIWLH